MAVAEVLDVDLLDPSLYRSGMPHALYAKLREIWPVLWHPRTHVPAFGSDIEFWAILGHKEVEQANRDWETFSAMMARRSCRSRGNGEASCSSRRTRRSTLDQTADQRRLHAPHDRPARGADHRTRTERILDEAAARGEIDFVSEIAYQLPMHVIADIVGIPEADRPEVFHLTEVIMRAADPFQGVTRQGPRRRAGRPVHLRPSSSARRSGRIRPTTCGRSSPPVSSTSSSWTCSSWC